MHDPGREHMHETRPESASVERTLMHREAAEASVAVGNMLAANRAAIMALGEHLRATPPTVIVTCARGSSDHAATYGKYLIETLLGVPVASAAPSVSSVYAAQLAPGAALMIAVSQSGRSPDVLATVQAYRAAGAYVVALVNDEQSQLAALADTVIGLKAGPERSIAATKSYICALAAFAALAAQWANDNDLQTCVDALPDLLVHAFALDWTTMVDRLECANNLFVIGRGYGYGIAQEAALKLKETCTLHAEAFSAAEVRHGPMAIIGKDFPIIAFATSDMAGDSVRSVAAEFEARGARLCLVDARSGGMTKPSAIRTHPAIEPILMIQSFYRMANRLSLRRNLDPDTPAHLSKVTQTV